MKRISFLAPAITALLTTAVLAPLTGAPTATAAEPPYTVTPLHFRVVVGPQDDQVCDIVGDLYLPEGASSTDRVPAILTTNGFGGSKDDLEGIGDAFARRGYAVLAYSGLGFGGSTCKITLDDPDWDGKAGSQLVGYLGGAAGVAYLDAGHTRPAPRLTVVRRDRRDHDGRRSRHDPRVGMIGGSYGGGVQFATASVDPRVDALVPFITWNDLSYSLGPNNTDQFRGVSSTTPGAAKVLWATGFSLVGLTGDAQNGQVPPDALPCPNFADWVCPALVTAGTTGYLQPEDVAHLRHASVATFVERIKVPTLLVQGQRDTLFNLNEAVATYRALQRQGTETKMIWQLGGHSGASAPGEISWGGPRPAAEYVSGRVLAWFERHLEGRPVGTGPEFVYFRDWVRYSGNARPAYGTASAYPVGDRRTWRLSGADRLVGRADTRPGSQSFVIPAAGAPTSLDEADVLGSFVGQPPTVVGDAPGTFAAWTTRPLRSALKVVGAPRVRLRVQAPTAAATQATGPAGQLVLFVKVADVAPDGTARLVKALEAPVRVPDVTKRFTVRLPAIVHRFRPGHRLRLVVAGGSVNYRGGVTATPVTIASGDRQTLSLPVLR